MQLKGKNVLLSVVSQFTYWKADLLAIFSILLLTLLFFWRMPVEGKVLLPLDLLHTYEPWRSEVPGALGVQVWNPWQSDAIRQFYPLQSVVQTAWQHAAVPFWNDYNLAGMPLLASGVFQPLYPPAVLLLLLLPVGQAISWGVILHTGLGGVFCYLFIRHIGAGPFGALIGALAFIFNGQIITWAGPTSVFPTIMWMPLLYLTVSLAVKRANWLWAVAGGVVLCLQILAGQLQVVLYTLTGLGLYLGYLIALDGIKHKNIRLAKLALTYLLVVLVVGVGLAAVQLVPTLELLPQGVRNSVSIDDLNNDFSPKILLRLLVPDILGTDMDKNTAPGFSHEVYVYFGLLPLIFMGFAFFSPHKRLAWGIFGIGALVWLVIYKIPPFYQLFDAFYPTFDVLGFHRAQILIAFFWAVAAGLGADWILVAKPAGVLRGGVALVGVAVVLFAVVAAALAFVAKYQTRFAWGVPSVAELQPNPMYLLASVLFALLILAVCWILLALWQHNRITAAVFSTVAVGVLVVDLFLAHIDFALAYNTSMLYPQTPSLAYLQNLVRQDAQPVRMMSVSRLFWGNMAAVFQLDDVQGYDSFLMRRYSQYLDLTGARADTNFRIAAFEAKTSKFLNALNVKYIYAPRYKLAGGDWISLLRQVGRPEVESQYSYAGQTADWTINSWPQPVVLAPTSSRITYRGFLDRPTRLETAIAIDPAEPAGATVLFEVYAQTEAVPQPALLFSQQLTQTDQPNWVPVNVELSAFTGQPVLVSLETSTTGGLKRNAGWADPLLSDASQVELLYYGPNSIYLNKNVLPRAWLVHQITGVAAEDVDAALAVMRQPNFDPASMAVIEGQLPAETSPATANESVSFADYGPSASTLTANLVTPGLLVVSDIYYPGWNVYVDGVRQPLYATNVAMRGVYLPAGEHQVRFVYEPRSFQLGLAISLTMLFIILIAVAGYLWRRRKQAATGGFGSR
ncbi:MAG: hypothetical protein FOGNACKC_04123 [Anaerolineae bacterium]|nr:hypothetical protein [Anaerolineae bacterium]